MDLSPDNRYSRHLALPQFGVEGQARLAASHVLIVGLGGLGSPVALYLAAAGIGRMSFADFDTVEVSNLQRQIAHVTSRVGELKTHSAREACLAINPECQIDSLDFVLEDEDLAEHVSGVSLVIDCTDNFPTRFSINAQCVAAGVPLVIGAAIRFDGQITVVDPRDQDSPCYRCLYTEGNDTADTCAQAGILGPVVGMIGCVQAIEAIKLLSGIGESLAGRLVLFDGLAMQWQEIRLKRSAACPICQKR